MGRSRLALLLSTFVLSSIVLGGCKRVKPPATETKSDSKGGKKDREESSGDSAQKRSQENLKQIGLALHNFEATYGAFPPATPTPGFRPNPIPLFGIHGWRVQILPFLEQQSLFTQIDRTGPIPASVKATSVGVYRSPLAGATSTQTPYRVFYGNGAAFELGKSVKISDFTDGLSNTILAVEAAESVDWADGPDIAYDPAKPLPKLGIFPGGFNALFGDGSVRWIPESTDEATIRALITRSGGEAVSPP